MQVLAALFIDSFATRQAEGGATRIDITGAHFSVATDGPFPVKMEPHLLALIHCRPDETGQGVFEVIFRSGYDQDSPQIARNVSPFAVDPGRFTYRLVRGEIEFDEPRQVIAHCRVNQEPWVLVPYTLLG